MQLNGQRIPISYIFLVRPKAILQGEVQVTSYIILMIKSCAELEYKL
jgi:hypothetical protein